MIVRSTRNRSIINVCSTKMIREMIESYNQVEIQLELKRIKLIGWSKLNSIVY